ncbi:MAG: glucose-6-phosphate isomerase [Lentisphaeria bacterium]|nr:glucose-6-phosphate isomerase [Lentisphaeria bacterium]
MSDWAERCARYTITDGSTGFELNYAGMNFAEDELAAMEPLFARAKEGIAAIERGEIKNPDEKRKVTHFTDRIAYCKSPLFAQVEEFARKVREGSLKGSTGKPFTAVAVNGIGGSALGPQLLQFAVNGPYWNELSAEQRKGGLKIYFLDNTDSAEFADLCQVMDPETTLHLVVSKSGGTQETKNNMTAMENFYAARGLDFGRHAAAVTMPGSKLDKHAAEKGFLASFEMADSIGGRTSESAIVGHVPAALTGIDFERFIAGFLHMDELTRRPDPRSNPAMMLSAMWYIAGRGRGDRNMVIVPYSDRLVLLSRYLQQLVMESLGKELDLVGKVCHQGLNVFGNKGGTDAHAFIQQLNDGRDDFFATFIEVLRDAQRIELGDGNTMGDYLHGFCAGLTAALRNKKRQTITVRIGQLTVFELGMLIALYERAVAIYAEFIGINAFHQPGVQAYKLAATGELQLKAKLDTVLKGLSGFRGTAADFAAKAGVPEQAAETCSWLRRMAANGAVKAEFDGKEWIFSCF